MTKATWEEFVERTLSRVNNKAGFETWLRSKSSFGTHFFDPYMYRYLYGIRKKVIDQKQDHFFTIIGGEGSGKSTLAFQIAAVLDPDFDRKNLCYTVDDFLWWLKNGKPGQVVWLDEGVIFLFSRDALSQGNKHMVKLITLMRQMRLIVIICIPRFKDIESKVRTQRVDSLIKVVKHARGRSYTCYFKKGAQIISDCLTKNVAWNKIRVPEQFFFEGYFTKTVPVVNGFDWEKYEELKRIAFFEVVDEVSGKKEGTPTDYVTIKEARTHFPVSEQTWINMIKKKTVYGLKVGGRWMISRKSLENIDSGGSESPNRTSTTEDSNNEQNKTK